MLVCVAADAVAKLLSKNRRWTLSSTFDVAQLSVAYAASALFADALHVAGGGPVAVGALAVAVLLVFFLVNTALVFAYLDLSGALSRDRLSEIALFQFVALAPARSHRHSRSPDLPRRTAPRGCSSRSSRSCSPPFVMRNLSSMERRVEEVSRQNRELDVDARHLDHLRRQRPRRPLRARLRRGRAPASRRGHGDPRVDRRHGRRPRGPSLGEAPRPGAATSSRGPAAAASTSAASTARPDSCETSAGEARELRLAAGTPYQVRVGALDLRDALRPARPRERDRRSSTSPRRSRPSGRSRTTSRSSCRTAPSVPRSRSSRSATGSGRRPSTRSSRSPTI